MAVTTARRPGGRPQYVIIRDIRTEGPLTEEDIEQELERAFNEEAEMIILEPKALGNEVSRWITVGNFLHKCSVLSGLVCFSVQRFSQSDSKQYVVYSFGALSVICAGFYAVSWKDDPCCKYQVGTNIAELEHMVSNLSSASPVVLVRRDDHRRRLLHNAIATLAGILSAKKLFN